MSDQLVDLPNGVRLCYRDEGDGEPLLLVAGLGQDLTSWPEPLVRDLVDRGFRVIRHDNRDVGRSSRVDAPPPATWRQLLVRPRPDAYTLEDMAGDTVGLLDHLGVDRVHLVGMSMGGMIAQTVAADHPDRVRSLTSIFSTTGNTRVGQAAWSTKLRLVKPPAQTREDFVRRHLGLTAHLAGRGFPLDEAVETAYAEGVWDRSERPGSGAPVARQIQAIQASGDRTERLRRVTAPTLVVHGDRDLIVHPSGGRATAEAVAGARHVSIVGMGHHLAPGLLDRLADLITAHTREAVIR